MLHYSVYTSSDNEGAYREAKCYYSTLENLGEVAKKGDLTDSMIEMQAEVSKFFEAETFPAEYKSAILKAAFVYFKESQTNFEDGLRRIGLKLMETVQPAKEYDKNKASVISDYERVMTLFKR